MIFSRLGWRVSPTFSTFFASLGKSQYVVFPTRVLPAPTAKTISVRFGASDTIRSICEGSDTRRPESSVISLSFERLLATGVVKEEQDTVSSKHNAALTIKSRDEEVMLTESKNTKTAELRFSSKRNRLQRD